MYRGYSDDSNVSGKSLRSILISIHELLIMKLSSEVHFGVCVANNYDKVHSISISQDNYLRPSCVPDTDSTHRQG